NGSSPRHRLVSFIAADGDAIENGSGNGNGSGHGSSDGNGAGHANGHGHPNGNGNGSLATEPLQTAWARPLPIQQAEIDGPAKTIPAWKRLLDVTFIALTLPVWLPLLLVVMVWIRAVSPGPIFYRQERVGYRRRHFMI